MTFRLSNQLLDFCISELKTVLKFCGIPLKQAFRYEIRDEEYPENEYEITRHSFKNFPCVYLDLNDDQKKTIREKIDRRCIYVNQIIDVISEGENYDEMLKGVDIEYWRDYFRNPDLKFKYRCNFMNAKPTMVFRRERIEKVTNYVQQMGDVDLSKDGQGVHVFWLFELHDSVRIYKQNEDPARFSLLQKVVFGNEIISMEGVDEPQFYSKYALKDRIYLGPTSTDEALAFFMVNQAQIRQGDLFYDPFVGTGSILISASHFKAVCYGSDIDARVIQGKGVGKLNERCRFYKENKELVENYPLKSILNYLQYGLPQPEILRMDACLNAFRKIPGGHIFDAIVCDPPYGLRATTRKTKGESSSKKEGQDQQAEEPREDEPKEVPTEVKNQGAVLELTEMSYLVKKLLDLSYNLLRPGGRLVYLFPIPQETCTNSVKDLYHDDRFLIEDFSLNILLTKFNRYCITMRKK